MYSWGLRLFSKDISDHDCDVYWDGQVSNGVLNSDYYNNFGENTISHTVAT